MMSKFDSMEGFEVDENLFGAGEAKLHGGMCKQLSTVFCRLLEIFPVLEAGRPRSKSGIQALCGLHVALDKAKNLLQHCSECSKLYLAITGESVILKFEKARCALHESLKSVEEIVPQGVGSQIIEMISELEGIVFALDQTEKQVGDEIITLLQTERKFSSNSNDGVELEVFHQAALKLGITSSRAALAERRALKKLIQRARVEEDKRKESIVAYLLHLMRKYSKLFRSEVSDDTDSTGSGPCSPTISCESNGPAFERQLSKLSSFNFKQNGTKLGNMQMFPEEFRCPISLQLMYDPVIISSGQTYERVCIEKWFNDGHISCPKSQQQLSHLGLTPNYCVKGLIASWCEQNGIPVPEGPPESLDLNYWRLALSEGETANSRSFGCVKEVKVVPLEESGTIEELRGDEMEFADNRFCQDDEVDEFERFERLLGVLTKGQSWRDQREAVEKIRFLLKDDEEVRIFMAANGFVEALMQFLRSAINKRDDIAQEAGALALFNLAVNNNRNKEMLLSGGITPLLENMISNSSTCESAAALYLNLSFLNDAKPVIGSSISLPFLVCLLNPDSPYSTSSKHDALYALFNLSTYPPNIPFLLSADIISNLHSLLTTNTWTEKALAVLINLVLNPDAKKQMASTPGLISSLAQVLDSGEPAEQEQVVACLLSLCTSEKMCIHLVLQEGIIPALVSISVNGSSRGKEKAQKLLQLFREQRQKEQSPIKKQELPIKVAESSEVSEPKAMSKSRSRRLGRTISSLWNNSKNHSVYQC